MEGRSRSAEVGHGFALLGVQIGFDLVEGVEALGDEVGVGDGDVELLLNPVTRSGSVKESRVPESKRDSSGVGSAEMSATGVDDLQDTGCLLMARCSLLLG